MEVYKICSALEKLKVDVEQHGRVDSRTAETVTQSFYEVEGGVLIWLYLLFCELFAWVSVCFLFS